MKLSKGAKWTLWIGIAFVFIIALISQPEPEIKQSSLDTARYACKEFLLKTLHDPASAQPENYRTWYAEERKDKTILVQPKCRAKNAFGAYRLGTWDCVVTNDGTNIRLVSMKQIRP